MTDRPPKALPRRADYRFAIPITTRWADNDVYAHANNVVYYAWFDTVVARFLLDRGLVVPRESALAGVVVETCCRYHRPLGFPDDVTAMLRVARIGTTSVRYEIGIFRNDEDLASADGHFVHVYVDAATQSRPQPLPPAFREALAPVLVTPA
jgi:acyl-CoA thioester hydrolase